MRILYGVVGEGMGHATRSRVVIDELLRQGHEVHVMASSRAFEFMKKRYGEGDVAQIAGLHLIYEENRVRRGKTLWTNVQSGISGLPRNIAAYFKLLEAFRPEVVVSDFESWTYLYGVMHRVPVISIDNMQIINRCTLDQELLTDVPGFKATKAFVKSKLPFCSHYLVTTFFRPPIRKERTTLVPPILRPELFSLSPTRGEHLLVYQTGEGYSALVDTLTRLGTPCRVYGMRRSITESQVEGSLTYRPFSEEGFLDDLASARGVIAGGGFSLMSEAVYLGKPVLSVPMGGQFEQYVNAYYLEKLGYGLRATSLDDEQPVVRFLDHLDVFAENLKRHTQRGNDETLTALTELLDRAEAGLL